MSRSYKKHPIEKWADSENYAKRKANRKFRRKDRQKDYEDEDEYLYNKTKEVDNNWDWVSEGYKYYSDEPKVRRK